MTHTHTHTQTHDDGIYHASTASCGKNHQKQVHQSSCTYTTSCSAASAVCSYYSDFYVSPHVILTLSSITLLLSPHKYCLAISFCVLLLVDVHVYSHVNCNTICGNLLVVHTVHIIICQSTDLQLGNNVFFNRVLSIRPFCFSCLSLLLCKSSLY